MKAFEVIVDMYQKPIFSAAYRICGSVEDAADITQGVFLKALQRLDSYDPAYMLFSWLYRISVNESLNFVRKESRTVPLDAERAAEADSGDDPALYTEENERRDLLQKALLRLKPEHRAVLVLKHLEELSYEEIADVLGIPEKLVKSRLFSARQYLRKELLELGVGR